MSQRRRVEPIPCIPRWSRLKLICGPTFRTVAPFDAEGGKDIALETSNLLFAGIPVGALCAEKFHGRCIRNRASLMVSLMFHTSENLCGCCYDVARFAIDRQANRPGNEPIVALGIGQVSGWLVVMSYPTGRRICVGVGRQGCCSSSCGIDTSNHVPGQNCSMSRVEVGFDRRLKLQRPESINERILLPFPYSWQTICGLRKGRSGRRH